MLPELQFSSFDLRADSILTIDIMVFFFGKTLR